MKRIPLTKGKYAFVDDADYEWLNQWKWCYQQSGYAVRYAYRPKRQIYMHKLILPSKKPLVSDHIDGNSLNNQRINLRTCTHRQNSWNSVKRKKGQSKYKGVTWSFKGSTYLTQVNYTRIGIFKNEIHAAIAYDLWAKDIYREYAKTNFPVV